MCGIVGAFSWTGSVDPHDALSGLVNHLAHRGPDEGAFWRDAQFFLGHRRLSIIDLSGGGQPMASADGSLVVTFNGEIYNYVELRDELQGRGCTFVTRSDTEVLLHGYREWGTDLPSHLVGMFAFAIADRRRSELFMARDRFGEKPLLYLESPGRVCFASELRPLAALPGIDRRLNGEALPSYLCLNYVPGDETLFHGVKRLMPGSWSLYTHAGVSHGEYWVLRPMSGAPALELEEAAAGLREALDHSVRMALRSDVPVGIFLSGGIDSSLVAESAARQGSLSQAYCLDFEEDSYSEWSQAAFVAERLGIPLMRVVLSAKTLEDFLRIVEHADDPLADSSALAVWTISRAASQHNKVVLGGDGGDELFAGYLTYKATAFHRATFARLPFGIRRALARVALTLPTAEHKVAFTYRLMRFLRAASLPSSEAHFTWNGVWLPTQTARLLRSGPARAFADDALGRMVRRHGIPEVPDLISLQLADLRDYLPNDILTKVDRMSMAHGLEVRAPFLESRLAQLALSLPAHLKSPFFGKPKRVLRHLARRAFGPTIADAKKRGFSIPIHGWVRGPGKDLAMELLSRRALHAIESLDVDAVERVRDEHMSGSRSYGWELWGLMVLSAWHRVRIAAPPGRCLNTLNDLVERRIARVAA
jgi:asparagine synthase (glutamine-hydrolysing)